MITAYSVAIPTYNGGARFRSCAQALNQQRLRPQRVLVIDSGSSDGTPEVAADNGFEVVHIEQSEFDHGGTRQLAVDLLGESEAVCFLTQDAVLVDEQSLEPLVASLADSKIGAAFGRQVPRGGAGRVEAFSRAYSYPAQSRTASLADIPTMGLSAAFCSNSFSLWRKSALLSVGGFVSNVCFGEDMLTAAKLLLSGWHIRYVAEAAVQHSHPATVKSEFQRSFDMGVMHGSQSWLEEAFGSAKGAASRYVWQQYKAFGLSGTFCQAVVLNLCKGAGYFIGRRHSHLSVSACRLMSMNDGYWNSPAHRLPLASLSQSSASRTLPSDPIDS